MDELDKHVKIISILSGLTEDQVLELSISDLKSAVFSIAFIYADPKTSGVRTSIRIKGNRFHINNNIQKLTGGEYITFASLIKDKGQVTANLPEIICLFFQPVNFLGLKKKSCYSRSASGEYIQKLDSFNKTSKLIRDHLTMDVVLQLSSFFLKSWQTSIKATQDYLLKMNRKNMKILAREMDSGSIGLGT